MDDTNVWKCNHRDEFITLMPRFKYRGKLKYCSITIASYDKKDYKTWADHVVLITHYSNVYSRSMKDYKDEVSYKHVCEEEPSYEVVEVDFSDKELPAPLLYDWLWRIDENIDEEENNIPPRYSLRSLDK